MFVPLCSHLVLYGPVQGRVARVVREMFRFGREEHLDALEVAVRAGCVVEREEESARRTIGERVVMVFVRERERERERERGRERESAEEHW